MSRHALGEEQIYQGEAAELSGKEISSNRRVGHESRNTGRPLTLMHDIAR